MKLIKSRSTIILLFLSAIYFTLRLGSFFTIPFFTDEADYIFFSKIILAHPDQGLVSLTQGVKPFFMWSMLPFLSFIHGNDLLAGRLSTLLMGFLSLTGIYFLAKELFIKTEIAILSITVFILFPYAQIYNNIAVLEGTVATFIILSLLFSIKLVRNPNFENSFFYGILTGFGILTKRHAFFSLYLVPFSLIFITGKGKFTKRLSQIIFFIVFSVVIVYLLQLVLYLSPYFERIAWFEGGPIYTKRAWLLLPAALKLGVLKENIEIIIPFLVSYLTLPYIFLLGYSLTLWKRYWKEIFILFSYFLIPVVVLAVFGRRVGERYVYPMTLPLVPIIGLSLFELWIKFSKSLSKKYLRIKNIRYYFYALFYFYPAFFLLSIIFSPINSPLTLHEKSQYYMCPMELFDRDIQYLSVISQNKKILLGTQNDLGFKNYMAIKLAHFKNITVKGYFPKDNVFPEELRKDAVKIPVYYARFATIKHKLSSEKPLKIISERKSPYAECTYRLYKVEP